jgi:hypothetical protein
MFKWLIRNRLSAFERSFDYDLSYVRSLLAADARSQATEPLREQVLQRFGQRGLVSLAFALTAARIFPTVKYALGHGSSCQRVRVQGELVSLVRSAA